MAKVWLITGSGNGLGRDIAEAALAAGDCVVAGARRTEELAPLAAQYGERVKPVTLEVREEAAAKAAVQLAVETFGRLDVVVNNAGYGQFAPFEQMSAEDFQAVVDTCFYGVVYTTRAAVPVMRKQKSGHIFQVSSVGGRLSVAGNTPGKRTAWCVVIPRRLPLNHKTASGMRYGSKNAPKEDGAEDYRKQHARCAVAWFGLSGQPRKTMANKRRG
jgi:NAD(P)-dependent dehydrogenase (short-subunit alcohol dehydrogenase family)